MANTQRLGSVWKGRAWDDGEPVPRITLPDGTVAEAIGALGYGWDATAGAWIKIPVDHTTGAVNINQVTVGWTASTQTALTTTATVSSAAGRFGGGMFINLNSAPAYIQVFDTTAAVTLGTTVPTFVIPVPANATAANGAAFVMDLSVGIAITNGIKVAATTTATGATTVSTALVGYVLYK